MPQRSKLFAGDIQTSQQLEMVKAVFSECQTFSSLQGQLDRVLEVYGVLVKYSSFCAPTEEQLRDALIYSLQIDSNTRRVTALC